MTATKSVPHQILILGGNFGGLSIAHHLLRRTIPSILRVSNSTSFHITLVSPNTHLYFKVGSPRGLINSTLMPESTLLQPLSEALSAYTPSQITTVQAVATAHDPDRSVVTMSPYPIESSSGVQEVHYDSLFITTGTTSKSTLWTLHHDQSVISATYKKLHALLPTARNVLIAGGGPVGVETAGEIAHQYPSIRITLLSGGDRLLQKCLPATSKRAKAYLEKRMHVTVLHDKLRVVKGGPEATTDVSSATPTSATIELSDGSEMTVDLYLDTTGGTPNSEFLGSDWLDATKRVVTADKYFRVKGNGSDDITGVFAVGDIVAGSMNSWMELKTMVPVACSSFEVDIVKQMKDLKGKVPVQMDFRPMKDTIVIPISRSGGVGHLMGWQMPSWFVWLVKGREYLTDMLEGMVTGSDWKKF